MFISMSGNSLSAQVLTSSSHFPISIDGKKQSPPSSPRAAHRMHQQSPSPSPLVFNISKPVNPDTPFLVHEQPYRASIIPASLFMPVQRTLPLRIHLRSTPIPDISYQHRLSAKLLPSIELLHHHFSIGLSRFAEVLLSPCSHHTDLQKSNDSHPHSSPPYNQHSNTSQPTPQSSPPTLHTPNPSSPGHSPPQIHAQPKQRYISNKETPNPQPTVSTHGTHTPSRKPAPFSQHPAARISEHGIHVPNLASPATAIVPYRIRHPALPNGSTPASNVKN